MTDMKILKDLSTGETDMTKLGELIGNHGALLKHAMKCEYAWIGYNSSKF